jgi:hypothetical protein
MQTDYTMCGDKINICCNVTAKELWPLCIVLIFVDLLPGQSLNEWEQVACNLALYTYCQTFVVTNTKTEDKQRE